MSAGQIGRIYRLGQRRPIDVYNLMSEPGIDPEKKMRILDDAGLQGTTAEDRINFIQHIGVKTDADPKLIEHIKSQGGGGGGK